MLYERFRAENKAVLDPIVDKKIYFTNQVKKFMLHVIRKTVPYSWKLVASKGLQNGSLEYYGTVITSNYCMI